MAMKLKKNFSVETRCLFFDTRYSCMKCTSNNMTSIHHITGRDSNRPINGIVLCHDCHAPVGHTQEEERNFFEITLNYLMSRGYELTDKDEEFIRSHPWLVTNFVK